MDAVVHYGEKSRDYLRSFENKRVDFSLKELSDWTTAELKSLLHSLQSEDRTFAETPTSKV